MNHYPGVSHRTFGFRTHDMSSIQFTRPLNQIEQTKNIRIEKNQMFSLNVSRKTMEPVCKGPVLSGQFSKSRSFAQIELKNIKCSV